MNISDRFFEDILKFQRERERIKDECEKSLQGLERYKGSSYYEQKAKELTDTRDAALKNLQSEYRGRFDAEIRDMKAANDGRKLRAPTDEQLKILQLLKMRDDLTEPELIAAANSLAGNESALEVLTELARQHGFTRGFRRFSKTMGAKSVNDILASLGRGVDDLLRFDTSRVARLYREHQRRMYGETPNLPPLPRRKLIEDKTECFLKLTSMNPDDLQLFFDVVDADSESEEA